MYSAFLLLSIWFFIIGIFCQRLRPVGEATHLLPLTFILSCIVQFNIGYLLIPNLQDPSRISKILLLMSCILMVSSLVVPQFRRNISSLFCNFLFPARQPEHSEGKSLTKFLAAFRVAILVAALALMLITQILTATVNNWDSHYYNLARIPAMLIEQSVFPENTGSLWQLLHPIGHDLLYLLDITVLSLRGMGLVSCLEFLIIIGCLYQIAFYLLSSPDSRELQLKTQSVLLLVTVLFLSSDLQVLQSADPKNDLVIVMTFMISLSLSVDPMLRRQAPFQYLLSILLVFLYSISAKAYGMIVLIPPFVVLIIDVVRIVFSTHYPWSHVRDSLKQCLIDGKTFLQETKLLFVFVCANAFFLAFTFLSHRHSITISPHSHQMSEMAAMMSNVTGSVSSRLANFALNAFRNFIAFVIYPYSTLLKWNAKAPDDYLFGFGPFTQLMNDPRGLINGTTVVRTIKADSAYGSIMLVPLLMVVLVLYSRKILQSRPAANALMGEQKALLGIRSEPKRISLTIILCCLLVFLFFSYALLGQSFGSKYMGSTYVPLIPLLSVGCVELIAIRRKILVGGIIAASCFALLRLGALLTMSMTPNLFSQLASPSSLTVNQSPNLLFYQYMGSRLSAQEASRWLGDLSRLSSEQVHVICFGTQTPSLTPLMYIIQSFSKDESLDIRLSSNENCSISKHPELGKSGRSVNFIQLP